MRRSDATRAARRSEREIKSLSPGLGTESQAMVPDGGTFIDSALLPPLPTIWKQVEETWVAATAR